MPTKKKAGKTAGKTAGSLGAKAGKKIAPHIGRNAWRLSKAEAKLIQKALQSQEARKTRYLKYAFFAVLGLGVGALLRNAGKGESSSFTGSTGHHSPDAGSPAGERNQTWGSGTVAGDAGGGAAGGQTARESGYSSDEPLIGQSHNAGAGRVPEQQQEVEQRIRTAIGEDARTMNMPRVNVEVTDGVAELRGSAPSDTAKQAAGQIAQNTEGVREVRNLLTVG